MKTKILGCIVVLGAAAGSISSCSEPLANCLVADDSGGPYIVTYIPQGTPPACAMAIAMPGEPVGMSFFHPEVVNSDGSTTFDASISHVAIQSFTSGNFAEGVYASVGVADTTPGDQPYAYGRFKAELPDANNLCYVVPDAAGMSCKAASAACSADEDCCNGQCNDPVNFTCTGDSDCPTGTTCGCAETMMPGLCDDAFTGGTCKGPSLCAALVDNMVSQQTFSASTDVPDGKPTIGMPCNATSTTATSCAADAATCTGPNDCCSGSCTKGACDPGMDTVCAGPPQMGMPAPTNAGVVCDPTKNQCVLGCRGMGGNSCDATFNCSSTDTTIGSCSLGADSVTYAWTNFQIYTTAAAQGTQFSADLTQTQTVAGAPCTVTYKAIGLWPSVACDGTDAMGNPTGMGDDDLCNPCAEPANGRATGSGINFSFPSRCSATPFPDGHFYCVLLDVASYKNDPKQAAKGVLSVTAGQLATSIPQLMPDGDARIPICQGE